MALMAPLIVYLALVLVLLYFIAHTGYGIKCARQKGNWRLALTIPLAVLVWHAAWVRGYTRGQFRRRRLLAGTYALSHGDSSR